MHGNIKFRMFFLFKKLTMKIAGSTIIFIFICIFLSRCSPENKANNTSKYQMVEIGVIKLPLDSFYGNSSVKSKTIIDGNGIEWLYANYPIRRVYLFTIFPQEN
jgi:hypothetical protein